MNHPNAKVYFFAGAQYYRFDFTTDAVDKAGATGRGGWIGVPTSVDAAVNHPDGRAYFFKGAKYYRFDFKTDKVDLIEGLVLDMK
jgi:hypothetical protein